MSSSQFDWQPDFLEYLDTSPNNSIINLYGTRLGKSYLRKNNKNVNVFYLEYDNLVIPTDLNKYNIIVLISVIKINRFEEILPNRTHLHYNNNI
jgi:hypothetical protein